MSTRQNTIEAWNTYQDKRKSIRAERETYDATWNAQHKKHINTVLAFALAFTVSGLTTVYMLIFTNSTLLASMGPGAVMVAMVVLMVNGMSKTTEFLNTKEALSSRDEKAYATFLNVAAEELKSSGVNVLSVNPSEGFMVTDRGNATVVTSEDGGIPQFLINGEPYRHNYLAETRSALNHRGDTITVPDTTA